jgi:DNA-binding IclR family transcriptional regulator
VSSFDRFNTILQLFDEARPDWTVQEMSTRLDIPASTVYRTVRDLTKAGCLDTSKAGSYRLGAAFVIYDRLIRLTDPLVRAGSGVLHDLVVQARIPCVGLLARVCNDTVMCIADEANRGVELFSSYERGRPMPLTRGATSKVILAQLPGRRLKKLLASSTPDAHPFALGAAELRHSLAGIRKQGFCITRGEIDPGAIGIAAPIVVPEIPILASISLVAAAATVDTGLERRLALLVVSSAALVADILKPAEDNSGGQAKASTN